MRRSSPKTQGEEGWEKLDEIPFDSEALFHTGWFVESLATQTLVIFVIRTAGAPWRHRPSWLLLTPTLAVVAVGVVLPFTPFAEPLGFVVLPREFFAFLAAATSIYLLLVEGVKRLLIQPRLA